MNNSAADDNLWFRIGLDAWRFGIESSMVLGLRAMHVVGELQTRVYSDVFGSAAAAFTPPALDESDADAQAQRNRELLAAVIPSDDGARRALPMYSGSRDIVPWHYDQ